MRDTHDNDETRDLKTSMVRERPMQREKNSFSLLSLAPWERARRAL